MYQAFQNILHGTGAIAGATLGGFLSDVVGWRMCFLAQLHASMVSLVLAYYFVKDMEHAATRLLIQQSLWQRLDLAGASLLSLA